jgi:hypothetical protein
VKLTALFPTRPGVHELALLHRYGVDCVYRAHPSVFDRIPAPREARVSMMPLWQQGHGR